MYYSQWQQDKYVYENFFQDKKDGFFVDIGAHDGISGSNSLFFEKLGWNGICVEPIESLYNQLIKNRKCICLNCCVYDKNAKVNFLENAGYTQMLSGIKECMTYQHLDRINLEIGFCGGESKEVEKEAMTLNDILIKYNINKVDFLSIDTEGSELSILKGIDFRRFNIDVISVENNYDIASKIADILVMNGYEYKHSAGGDEIYRKK